MLFLIDSNIAIASEPLGVALEPGAESVIEFLSMASLHHHDLRTHPASLADLARIPDEAKRKTRLALFERYEQLASPPPIGQAQLDTLGTPQTGSNDEVDQHILAAVVADAAECLVTEDRGIHRKARRLGVSDRVLTVSEANSILHALHADLPNPPPAVNRVKVHQLNLDDPIFDGLKADYPEFEDWFRRTSRTQRDGLVIEGDNQHAAIAILKQEPEGAYGLAGPALKISTFKVADGYSGQKYGELLLKTIFHQAHIERDKWIYVTVFSKHQLLLGLLEDFGFEPIDATSPVGELVYAKPHGGPRPTGLSALEYQIRYGPPALAPDPGRWFLVPIQPKWHRLLFPDAEPPDEALLPATAGLAVQPFGNALRKAYLCNSPSRLLRAGDTLLFYRTSDEQAVFVVGVCEEVITSFDAQYIAATVGRRTVYSVADIEAMTRRGEVLVVLFRQDRVLADDPIELPELQGAGICKTWPQSISQVRTEGEEWLAQRLNG